MTSAEVHDAGLTDNVGNIHFNPPSLRGVSQLDRLLHGSRAGNLRDIFTKFQHSLGQTLRPQELEDLVTYLKSL